MPDPIRGGRPESGRDEHGGNFGRQLRFVNAEGQTCKRISPMRLLSEGGTDLRRRASGHGADPGSLEHRAELAEFIMESSPKARIVAATTTGWHDDVPRLRAAPPGR
ncbi:MAG: DUF927 domain-containing protein [Halomonas sp.]|uniref:DUF927 domain-containing protein n=1 Tax=Halomonas sp. TaxID=1486246 RepID=UPI002ACDF2D2|nr:DUF927 domain-containing protein [Halomonas sp.]MDZ7852013.1 DUF927 domain-containing protein [Halomonas sp.]